MLPQDADARIKALELRVSKLEKALQASDTKITLQLGSSRIALTSNDITVDTPGNIQIKAANNLVLKGSRIVEN